MGQQPRLSLARVSLAVLLVVATLSVGCWKATATYKGATLSYVYEVR